MPTEIVDSSTKLYTDSTKRIWIIKKESLPKKRGEYKFYTADSLDGKDSLREQSYKNILNKIENKIG